MEKHASEYSVALVLADHTSPYLGLWTSEDDCSFQLFAFCNLLSFTITIYSFALLFSGPLQLLIKV